MPPTTFVILDPIDIHGPGFPGKTFPGLKQKRSKRYGEYHLPVRLSRGRVAGGKHQFIPDGVFENSRNPREATVVVEAVLEHMRKHPDESLGIVTLNFEQRELVEELLDRRLRDDPAAIAYQEKMTGGQESLFVKNLENVQGDERDVIFISTTYGADARGNQFQRFGPINGPNGHRRLNVLFTRSKKRTVARR